ncbi:BAG family molecular chaperone regulator 8, chloroplastic [Syzygium oleosum]|uniref:BAG family molecular chaperone regulator 8, chloroplastic n=1 Tax=Syzygium oleosum TaxID=219896 RepID=UPI0024BAB58C|nr:BAG family molecular chaperone regulator 8, chloroplastic [Syzygium oleosum]
MAHPHHHPPPPPTPGCCSSYCCHSGAAHHPPPQPPLDPLVEALISRLLQPPPPPPQEPHNPFPRTRQETSFGQPHHRHPRQQQLRHHPDPISSLLDRIEALESSLRSFSVSPPPPPASCRRRRFCPLRDAAARVIQGHFRALLVRRSRALRDLERLASIKSAAAALRSSVYASSQLDLDRVSRKVTALLLQLDSIQGNSPVIRDSKRKISRDLGCLLEYIDSVAVKRYEISYKAKKCVKSVGGRGKVKDLRDQRDVVNNLRTRVERVRELSRALENDAGEDGELEGFHGVGDGEVDGRRVSRVPGKRCGVKKAVNFAEDGNVYRIISSNSDEASSSGDDRGGIGGGEVLEDFRAHNEVEEMKGSSYVAEDDDDDDDEEEEAEKGSEESLESSDGEKHQGRVRSKGKVNNGGACKGQNSKFSFSAPVPEKMESRADLVKNRKNVKISTSQQ